VTFRGVPIGQVVEINVLFEPDSLEAQLPVVFEIDPERVALARENFQRAGVAGLVTIVEGDAHKNVTKLKEPIDIVYLDADKGGNLDYLNKLLPRVRPGGLILAHDTTDSAEYMRDYLDAVTNDSALETVFLNAGGPGIGVTLKKRMTE
jgi:predicted O-methyltransferase YrrM